MTPDNYFYDNFMTPVDNFLSTYWGKRILQYSWTACCEVCPTPSIRGTIWVGHPYPHNTTLLHVGCWVRVYYLSDDQLYVSTKYSWKDLCKWGGHFTHVRVWRPYWLGRRPNNKTIYDRDIIVIQRIGDWEFYPKLISAKREFRSFNTIME